MAKKERWGLGRKVVRLYMPPHIYWESKEFIEKHFKEGVRPRGTIATLIFMVGLEKVKSMSEAEFLQLIKTVRGGG